MQEEPLTSVDLLEQWRDASRAAELAERLARMAADNVARADRDATAAESIARMAERAAKASERAAASARKAADRAAAFAHDSRARRLADADQSVLDARADETTARDLYHDAEKHPDGGRASAPRTASGRVPKHA